MKTSIGIVMCLIAGAMFFGGAANTPRRNVVVYPGTGHAMTIPAHTDVRMLIAELVVFGIGFLLACDGLSDD